MVRRSLLLLLAMSCAEGPSSVQQPLAAAQAPPVTSFDLALGSPAVPGYPLVFDVTGAPPGADVRLVFGAGEGAGLCPEVLGGGCLGILSGPSGYRTLANVTADDAGAAQITRRVPSTVPAGTRTFQAVVVAGDDSALSNVLEVNFTDPVCVDDGIDNHRIADAVPLPARTDGVSCDGAVDFWWSDVPPGAVFETVVSHEPLDGDVDVELLDSTGRVIDGSYTIRGDEVLTWANTGGSDETVYVMVYSWQDPYGDGVPYTMVTELEVPAVCVDDANDDDDDASMATPLTTGTVTAQACPQDSDWYQIDVTANTSLDVTLDVAQGEGTVMLTVYDENLVPVDVPAPFISHLSAVDQTMFIEVMMTLDDALGGGATYALTVDAERVFPCVADAFEPNDSQTAAAQLVAGVYTDLLLCSDEDHFYIDMVQGQELTINALFDHDDADIDMVLRNPATGGQIVRESATDNESVNIVAGNTGVYELEMYLYDDRGPPVVDGGAYSLEIIIQ